MTGGPVNVISGNGENGIAIFGSNNLINGDYIGVDLSGKTKLGNGSAGITVSSASGNTIGLPMVKGVPSNVISNNGALTPNMGFGIELSSSSGNLIQGSYIGLAADGTTPMGNQADGIYFPGGPSSSNTIGGAGAGAGNVISANGLSKDKGHGVTFLGGGKNNLIQNNIIGFDKTGKLLRDNASGWMEDDNAPGADQWIGNQHP
jgi:hypothetical protein